MEDVLEGIDEHRIAERLMLYEGCDFNTTKQRTRELHAKIAACTTGLREFTTSDVAEATGEVKATVDLYLNVRYRWHDLRGAELDAEEAELRRETVVVLREHGEVPDKLHDRLARLADDTRNLAIESLLGALALLLDAVNRGVMSVDEARPKIKGIQTRCVSTLRWAYVAALALLVRLTAQF